MLFSLKHAIQIKEGRRTLEFRTRMPREHTIGKTYAVQVRPAKKGEKPGAPLARVQLVSVHPVRLDEVTPEDARAAGYADLAGFKRRWTMAGNLWEPARIVYRTEYRLIGPPLSARIAS